MTEKIKNYPTIKECEALWEQYHTPPHVIAHCKGVTEVAVKVASALNASGYDLDIPLIQAAGLLHDLLRVEEEHGSHAAAVVEQLGYDDVANIIRVHMSYQIPADISSICEMDMVCLGDRVVLEDHFVGLDLRMQYIIDKSRKNGMPDAESRIKARFSDIRLFISKIEASIGTTLKELMG